MISIVKTKHVPIEETKASMLELFKQLDYNPTNEKIFLKPNIVDATPPLAPTITHPIVVEGIILALHEKGAREFVIGENSGYFSFKQEHFDRLIHVTEYGAMINRLKEKGILVTVENLEFAKLKEYEWEHGTIKIPELCETHEYINIPKMKTHMMTGVTLSLKNQKGLLLLGDKKKFHLGYDGDSTLHKCITEFGNVIQPELNIVDATTALEGTGPAMLPTGQTAMRVLDLCIGGRDMVEVDNACCTIMGVPLTEALHIPERDVTLATGSLPLEPATPPFAKPDKYIKFNKIYQRCSSWGCTNCQMGFSRMMRKIVLDETIRDKFNALQEKHDKIDFYIGKLENIPTDDNPKIFFGQCTKKASDEVDGIFIAGCPANHNDAIEAILYNFG